MDKLKIWVKENPKKAVIIAVLVLALLGAISTGASA